MRIVKNYFVLLSLPIIVFAPTVAAAHDGWIEITPAIVEKGQPVTIALMHGNHSNEHRSYRLADKWDLAFSEITVSAPSGRSSDLTAAAIDLGEDLEKTGPKGPKGFHIAQFVAEDEGAYAITARQERTVEREDGAKFRSVRFARNGFAALAVPTVGEALKLPRFESLAKNEDGLEIIPVTHTVAVIRDSSV